MADFKAYIKDGEIIFDGPDDKVDMFAQFIEEIEEATDASACDCSSNDKVREVVEKYFPDYADDIMEMFEDNYGYCNCEIGSTLMTQNSIIKKMGRFMNNQEI